MRAAWSAARAVAINLLGWGAILGGLALIPLPGPGILISFAGVAILSTRYAWARKVRKKTAHGVEKATRESVANKKRIVFTLLSSALVACLGVAFILDPALPSWIDFEVIGIQVGPHLPGAGLLTGIPVCLSAVVAVGLLIYARLRYGAGGKDED